MPESRKGKNYEEIYGEERAREIRKQLSILNTDKKRSLKSRLKQSNSIKGTKNHFYGKHHTLEARTHMGIRGEEHPMKRPEIAKRHGDTLRGRSRLKDVRIKIGLAKMGEKNPMKRPEVRRKVSIKQTENYKDPEARERMGEAVWSSPLFQKWYHHRYKGPNKTESKFEKILQHDGLPFEFVGDGQLIIGGMCPDYANYNGDKQLIELYGDYWHKGDNPQVRIDAYKKYGYDCLVVWEHEIRDENKVLNRVRDYLKLE